VGLKKRCRKPYVKATTNTVSGKNLAKVVRHVERLFRNYVKDPFARLGLTVDGNRWEATVSASNVYGDEERYVFYGISPYQAVRRGYSYLYKALGHDAYEELLRKVPFDD
jgi:hypothetical protein